MRMLTSKPPGKTGSLQPHPLRFGQRAHPAAAWNWRPRGDSNTRFQLRYRSRFRRSLGLRGHGGAGEIRTRVSELCRLGRHRSGHCTMLAPADGVEPPLPVSETWVLPLYEAGILVRVGRVERPLQPSEGYRLPQSFTLMEHTRGFEPRFSVRLPYSPFVAEGARCA